MKENQWKFLHTLYYFLFSKKNKEKKTYRSLNHILPSKIQFFFSLRSINFYKQNLIIVYKNIEVTMTPAEPWKLTLFFLLWIMDRLNLKLINFNRNIAGLRLCMISSQKKKKKMIWLLIIIIFYRWIVENEEVKFEPYT